MPRVLAKRMTGEFVVFLIGMRINRPWKIHKWLPVAMAMPRMIQELSADKDSGFPGIESGQKINLSPLFLMRTQTQLRSIAKPP